MKYIRHELQPSDVRRMEELYLFLLSRGDRWTSMEQVTDSISAYPCFFKTNYHNSSARRMLTADVAWLNEQGPYDGIIISGNKGIKLANKEELGQFIRAELAEIFRKLKRVRMIAAKANLDQQYDLDGAYRDVFMGGD